MNKEDYTRLDIKLDRHTDMLIEIKDDMSQEINLLKLAHQKLKFMTFTLVAVFILKVYIDYPKLAAVISKLL